MLPKLSAQALFLSRGLEDCSTPALSLLLFPLVVLISTAITLIQGDEKSSCTCGRACIHMGVWGREYRYAQVPTRAHACVVQICAYKGPASSHPPAVHALGA